MMSEFISIPAGEFFMGISKEEAEKIIRDFFPPEADISPYLFYNEVPEHKANVQAFSISKFETTNEEFQEFVNAGGYQKKELWEELQTISNLSTDLDGWERINLLKDRSGRFAPANWENGSFPKNQADHPVQCVSWFEAVAY